MCQNWPVITSGSASPEEAGEEGEVVVLDEDGGGAAVDFLEDLVGEGLVDLGVGLPVGLVEDGFDEGVVAEGPEALVGDAVVVALLLLVGEPEEFEGVGGVVRGDHYAVFVVDGEVVAGAAAVGEPGAGAFLHEGVDGGGDAAGGGGDVELSVDQVVDVGLAVGDDDDAVVADFAVYEAA